MTDREKAIAMAYTGICFLQGEKLKAFYDYTESLVGHVILTHELLGMDEELKEKAKADFIAMCEREEAEPVRHAKWRKSQVSVPKTHEFCCSACATYVSVFAPNCYYKYCPNCGARMDGGKDK